MSADQNGTAHEVRRRAALISLSVGTVLCAVKFGGWWVTDSAAVLSDALESTVNVAAALLLLYSVIFSLRPADRNHPYGHGKVEYFSAGVEGALILAAAVLIIVAATRELLRGPSIHDVDLGLLVVAFAGVVNFGLGRHLVSVGRREGSAALVADGRHVLTDTVTSAGVVIGLGAVWITGWKPFDPIMALLVAVNILRTGWQLLRAAIGGLMDEADPKLLESITATLEKHRQPAWIDVHGLRAVRRGSKEHVEVHLVIPRYWDADRLHQESDAIEQVMLDSAAISGGVIVHFDPCRPQKCPGCLIGDCPVREAPFAERTPLTLDRVTREDEPLDRP